MKNRIIYLILAVSCAMVSAYAQQPSATVPGGRSFVPSEMELTESASCGRASIGADITSGSFHRPQEADTETGIFFIADGDRQVGRFRLKGRFDFRQSFENGIRYASTFNPLRDMPYIIADSTGGNWRKQDYSMWADISAHIAGPLYAGLSIDLEAGRGAKKVDPRPQASMNVIGFTPALSLKMGRAGTISAGFAYTAFKEVSNMILYDSSTPQKLYLLKGLGQYTYEIFSNTERERKYAGDNIGALLSWKYSSGHSSVSVSGGYRNGRETVFDIDYNKPHYRGRYITDRYSAGASYSYDSERLGIDINAEYSGSRGSGREFVQYFDSSPEVNSWITDSEIPGRYIRKKDNAGGEALIYIKSDGKSIWAFRAKAVYGRDRQTYRAMSSSMAISSFSPEAGAMRNLYWKNSEMSIGLSGGYRFNLGDDLMYVPRETTDTNISEGLVMADYEILKSDYFHIGCNLGYGFGIRNAGDMHINLSGRLLRSAAGLCRCNAVLSVAYRF